MATYPVLANSFANASSGSQTPWSSGAGIFDAIAISVPKEFDGPNSGFSPEDLFAMALVNCFVATFKVIAEKRKFAFGSIDGKCEISIDQDANAQGLIKVVGVAFHFKLTGGANESQADRLLNQISKQCILINSVSAPKTFEFEIVASAPAN